MLVIPLVRNDDFVGDLMQREAEFFDHVKKNLPLPDTKKIETMGLDTLTEPVQNEKQYQNNPNYAAMVYHMDENVGRLIDSLKTFGLIKSFPKHERIHKIGQGVAAKSGYAMHDRFRENAKVGGDSRRAT